jgi:glutaredoxin/uncharacterized membrane protein YphA (DoxX/SURF4 family)
MKTKSARIDRMITPDHMCPWGLKGKNILERKGYELADNHIDSMDENKKYKEEHGVDETPQIWIEGEHIGGYDDLRAHLGMYVQDEDADTYVPIIAIFATTFLMALGVVWKMQGGLSVIPVLEIFIAISMCVLGIQKTRDLSAFTSGFLSYDLLARKCVPYAFVYPFIETGAGILMLAGIFPYISAPATLFIATIGAVSVFKAVYIEKRELECACMGGGSNVPLGFLSLTENLMMILISIWMISNFIK